MTISSHPYFPSSLHLPNLKPNTLATEVLLGVVGAVISVVILLTWNLVTRYRPEFSRLQKTKICWFAVSGLIHLIIEGYFASYYQSLTASHSFLAQIWKEYAKGDSRYISADAFTVVMETFTCLVDGPLCLITVWAYLKNKPYAHVLQILVSAAQFYGDLLYLLIEWFEGFTHGPQFHFLYFWTYFVFMNSFWLIVPAILIVESSFAITAAFRQSSGQKFVSRRKWD